MSDIISGSEDEKLRQENEIRKLKLSLERGASFSSPIGKAGIDPAIENDFLRYIEHFESAYENCKRIKLYEYLGRPEFHDINSIDPECIEAELDQLMLFMQEQGVFLDTLCPVEPAVLYRFITEELFEEEIDDMHIAGMESCFIYEDFHPNDDYDLRRLTDDFLKSLLDTENDFYSYCLVNDFAEKKKIEDFRQSFSSFSEVDMEIKTLEIQEQNAKIVADFNFTGQLEGSAIRNRYSGDCLLEFEKQFGYWGVSAYQLPENFEII